MNDLVHLQYPEEHIALVRLEDRQSKNRATDGLRAGVTRAFEAVEKEGRARTVVVHGYDPYFCCGGTQEELLLLAGGKVEFTAFDFYDRLLRCPLPVIAAMQGHAIGGGLVFGAFADLMVMAEECLYSANFMQYGFTPGLGATCIIPEKFGALLGAELLFTAKSFYGGELRRRGAPMRIVPKSDVIAVAMGLARDLAEKPLLALRELKQRLTAPLRPKLAEAVRHELEMQRLTLAQPEVIGRIKNLYGT